MKTSSRPVALRSTAGSATLAIWAVGTKAEQEGNRLRAASASSRPLANRHRPPQLLRPFLCSIIHAASRAILHHDVAVRFAHLGGGYADGLRTYCGWDEEMGFCALYCACGIQTTARLCSRAISSALCSSNLGGFGG